MKKPKTEAPKGWPNPFTDPAIARRIRRIAPELAEFFPSSVVVNEALRNHIKRRRAAGAEEPPAPAPPPPAREESPLKAPFYVAPRIDGPERARLLDEDLAAPFPDSKAMNEALRSIEEARREQAAAASDKVKWLLPAPRAPKRAPATKAPRQRKAGGTE